MDDVLHSTAGVQLNAPTSHLLGILAYRRYLEELHHIAGQRACAVAVSQSIFSDSD